MSHDNPQNLPTAGRFKLEFFPEELNALRVEIANHPALMERLAGQDEKDVYVQISEISAYCGVLLDGFYTREDIVTLCGKLTDQLRARRVSIIIPL